MSRPFQRLMVLFLMGLLGLAGGSAWAQDFITARGLLDDPQGQLRIEEVANLPFQPLDLMLARGYTAGVTWQRIEVQAPTGAGSSGDTPLLLTVQPSYLDDVQLYSPVGDGPAQWQVQQGGDRFAFSDRARRELPPTFNIVGRSAPLVYYLRVHTTSSHSVYVTVATEQAMAESHGNLQLGLGVYLGLCLALGLSSLAGFGIWGDKLWLANTIFTVVSVMASMVGLGLHHKLLWPSQPAWADAATSATFALNLSMGNVFSLLLYRSFGAPRWVQVVTALGASVLPLQWYAIATGQTRWAMALNSNLILLGTLFSAVVVWFLLRIEGRLTRWLVRGTYSVYLGYLVFHILPVLGVGRLTQAHVYPALLSNLFTAVTMFLILLRRQTLINREQAAWGEQMKQTQLSLVWERQRGEERASFMSMLLHELKNPLASIRLSALSLADSGNLRDGPDQRRVANIAQATQGIDDVLERCRQVDQLEQGNWHVNASRQDIALQCREWAAEHPLGARLTVQAPDTLVATVDLPLLHTIVRNLLDNAQNYSAPNTPVSLGLQGGVRTRQEDGAGAGAGLGTAAGDASSASLPMPVPASGFEVRVSNHVGKAGWPDPQRVFTKYYRAERAYQSTGSGLGLYLVRCLGRMLGGEVSYRPADQKVVFVVWLPCA